MPDRDQELRINKADFRPADVAVLVASQRKSHRLPLSEPTSRCRIRCEKAGIKDSRNDMISKLLFVGTSLSRRSDAEPLPNPMSRSIQS